MAELSSVERERITDSMLKIASVRTALEHVAENKIPAYKEIGNCLKSAHHNLRLALGYARPDAEFEP